MRIISIIQARMGSTRLPGKAMLPLAGKPLTYRLLERVKRARMIQDIVLAVPDGPKEQPLREVAAALDIGCIDAYPTDENDLVTRHLEAAEWAQADLIVRIPGDNPCVDQAYIDQAIRTYLHEPHLYYSNTTDLCGDVWLDGIGAEVFSLSRLQWLDAKLGKGDVYYREHPHAWFLDHRLYDLHQADYRLDVNTQEDYEYVKDIFEACYRVRPEFTSADVVQYLDHRDQVHG